MTLTPGVYDLPEADYFAATDALSCSGAKLLLPPSCPALFRYRQDHPEHKDVFDFGSAAHRMVLGAGPSIVTVDAPDWRGKSAKDSRDAIRADGMIPLLVSDAARVEGMAAALRQHPLASGLLDPERGGKAEQSLFWDADGIRKRARLDWLDMSRPGLPVIPDFKTCMSAEPGAIRKAVANFGYHQQADMYSEAVEVLTGDRPDFLFIFQEKTAPYLVTVVRLDDEAMAIGRARNQRAVEIYKDCLETDQWPGFADWDITELSLPAWASRGEDW